MVHGILRIFPKLLVGQRIVTSKTPRIKAAKMPPDRGIAETLPICHTGGYAIHFYYGCRACPRLRFRLAELRRL
jgi:hypothetical protein